MKDHRASLFGELGKSLSLHLFAATICLLATLSQVHANVNGSFLIRCSKGNTNLCNRIAQSYHSTDSSKAVANYYIALNHIGKKEFSDARRALKLSIKLGRQRNLAFYLRRLSSLERSAGNILSAIEAAERAISLEPHEKRHRSWRAILLAQSGRNIEAERIAYDLAISEKDSLRLRRDLVEVLILNGREREALDILNRLIINDKLNEDLWHLRAQIYYRTGNLQEALKEYQRLSDAHEHAAIVSEIRAELDKALMFGGSPSSNDGFAAISYCRLDGSRGIGRDANPATAFQKALKNCIGDSTSPGRASQGLSCCTFTASTAGTDTCVSLAGAGLGTPTSAGGATLNGAGDRSLELCGSDCAIIASVCAER